jgi:glycerol-3-phosphate O-acyltransferase / dihydroxyacetone phosphate acyltransferase
VLLYRFFRSVLRLALSVFFRRVEVVGREHIPRSGPVIFCGNHPNSLLDPVLITATCGRIVHFAAKDVLFRSRFLRFFLRALGAVPVQRRKDHAGGVSNEAAFEQLYRVLARGRTMGIFPEGISHDSTQLVELKTGAARIALGASRRHEGLRVRLVPCGLTYVTRNRFRSSVLVQFGEPIEVDEAWLARFEADERAEVRALTEALEQGLRALTVNAEDWDTLRLLDGVRRLYQPRRIRLEDRIELARRFNREYPRVKDEPVVVALLGRVRAYLERLAEFGISDADLRRDIGMLEATFIALRYGVFLFLWLPLAVLGAVVHLPIALLLGLTGERLAPRRDVIATTKFVAGFLVLGLLYVTAPVVSWLLWGWKAGVVVLVLLPATGFATLRVLERAVVAQRLFSTAWRMLRLGREIRQLRAERAALEAAVVQAVNTFKPPDMELLFPRDTLEAEDSL